MIVRELERRPWRTLLSAVGIAMAVGIVVIGQFNNDATDYLIHVQFHRIMREDLSVSFLEPKSERAVIELGRLPGVVYAEGLRYVPVRLRSGPRFRDSVLVGLPANAELHKVIDQSSREAKLPKTGILLTKKAGEILGVQPGERLEVEIREGARRTEWLTVAALVDESFGLQGYLQLETLQSLLRENGNVSTVLLRIDPTFYDAIHQRLKKMPAVSSVIRRDNVAERFEQQSGQMMRIMTFILTLFAVIIAVGVVYNNARVALSVRSRDLATLRVLGFTQHEVSNILLGELGVQVALGIPLGLVFGRLLATLMMSTVDPETYRLQVIISFRTYALATVVIVLSSFVSALLVRRRINRLDLIAVLKARE
jgi:putative ABC transport system permease protein